MCCEGFSNATSFLHQALDMAMLHLCSLDQSFFSSGRQLDSELTLHAAGFKLFP